MTSVAERVLTGRAGVLSHLAFFVPIEIGRLNRAGRASTEAAFRQIAESYARSALIRPFMPRIGMPARDIVAKTLRAILPPARTKFGSNQPSHLYRELNLNCLELIVSNRKKTKKKGVNFEKMANWLNDRDLRPT